MIWDPNFLMRSPLFLPLQPAYERLGNCENWPTIENLNHAKHKNLVKVSKQIISFIPQSIKSNNFSEQYEPRIYERGEIQTREQNWHDFFNALVWFTFPKTKAALNALQYRELYKRHAISNQRSSLENALTLFDENGIIAISNDNSLLELIRKFSWLELFWHRREEVIKKMRFYIIGHSLYEKALNPYVGMTASGILLTVDNDFLQYDLSNQLNVVDLMMENELKQNKLRSPRDLQPLPILGIPGWSKENEFETYYHNKNYFREKSYALKTGIKIPWA